MSPNRTPKFTLHDKARHYFWKHPRTHKLLKDFARTFCIPCFCLYVCTHLDFKCGTAHRHAALRRLRRNHELEYHRRAQTFARRNSLSVAPPPSPSLLPSFLRPRRHRSKPVQAQAQSPLFARLPAEIRREIWRYVLEEPRGLHVAHGHGRLVIGRCPFVVVGAGRGGEVEVEVEGRMVAPLECAPRQEHIFCADLFEDVVWGYGLEEWEARFAKLGGARGGLLGVVGVCRRVYMETIDMLYANNVFYISMGFDLYGFVRSIPPAHLARIQHVALLIPLAARSHNPMEEEIPGLRREAWAALSRMPNLRTCRVIVRCATKAADEHSRWAREDLERRAKETLAELRTLAMTPKFIVEAVIHTNVWYWRKEPLKCQVWKRWIIEKGMERQG